MKKIFCPMCGKEMQFTGVISWTNRALTPEFTCKDFDCKMLHIRIKEIDEKSARRAWNDGLIGQLRKWYKENPVLWGDIYNILSRMFGGEE